jgi:hypothetical protein
MNAKHPPKNLPQSDQFQRYRDQAAQLEEALKALAACESDIEQLHGQLDGAEAALKAAYDAEKPDFDRIDALTLRAGSINKRLVRDEQRLLGAQHDVQDRLMALASDLSSVYQVTRNALISKATDEILGLLDSSARVLQRANAGALAILHAKVVQAATLEPSLHPVATQPLEDNLSRAWSRERSETMRVARDECRRVLDALPRLLSAASECWPEAPQSVTVVQQEAA